MKQTAPAIVCATDFSPNAQSAADVAAAIASRIGARLHLLHVADEARSYAEDSGELRAFLRRIRARLRQEALRLRRGGAEVGDVLVHGSWAETAVVEYVERENPLLVVVSSVSKTAFDRWTIGSVSERIAQQSPVPTLVVREPERLLGWVGGERELNVLVAMNFTASSDAALSWVRELRKVGACAVTAAHIFWPPAGKAGGERAIVTKQSPAARGRLVAELKRRIAGVIEGEVEVRVESAWGRPDAPLVQLAGAVGADLMVVGTRQWHGLKRLAHPSISRGILRHAPMNVACVPAAHGAAHGPGHRPRIRRVLVATDFSLIGDRAVPWAYATVVPGGVVKLVHVLSPWELPGPLVPHYDPKRITRSEHRRRMEDARARLAALVPPEGMADNVTTEVEVIADRDPARAISVAAERFGADVVCLGSHGRTNLAEALRGSVARAVVAHSSHPVLLVQPAAP